MVKLAVASSSGPHSRPGVRARGRIWRPVRRGAKARCLDCEVLDVDTYLGPEMKSPARSWGRSLFAPALEVARRCGV